MSFDFHLYRAPPGLGPLPAWEDDHAEPLGHANALRERIAALFPSLAWQAQPDGWLAYGGDAADAPRELSVAATASGQVPFVVAYASPPVLRALMRGLGLNYCCAVESGELRDPFSVGADWDARS